MARQRFQDPSIRTRTEVERPFYWIRPYVTEITGDGLKRRQKFVMLGYCDEITLRKAERRKRDLMQEINHGQVTPQSQVGFGELAAEFKRVRLPQLGAATRTKYTHHLTKHLEPALGNLKLCEVNSKLIETLLAKKQELSWATKTDIKNLLSAIFTQAAKWGMWKGENPARHVAVGRRRELREKRLLSGADLNRLLNALPETIRLIVLITCMLGLRISEVLGLRWRDINLASGELRVVRRFHRGDEDEPKSSRSKRTRQLGPLASELARRYAGPDHDDEPVFLIQTHHRAKKGESVGKVRGICRDDRTLNRCFLRPAAKSLGLYYAGFGFHVFRRMNVTWRQTIGGASPMEAMLAAGHTKLQTTSEYFVVDAERERQQVALMLAQLFQSQAEDCKRLNESPSIRIFDAIHPPSQ